MGLFRDIGLGFVEDAYTDVTAALGLGSGGVFASLQSTDPNTRFNAWQQIVNSPDLINELVSYGRIQGALGVENTASLGNLLRLTNPDNPITPPIPDANRQALLNTLPSLLTTLTTPTEGGGTGIASLDISGAVNAITMIAQSESASATALITSVGIATSDGALNNADLNTLIPSFTTFANELDTGNPEQLQQIVEGLTPMIPEGVRDLFALSPMLAQSPEGREILSTLGSTFGGTIEINGQTVAFDPDNPEHVNVLLQNITPGFLKYVGAHPENYQTFRDAIGPLIEHSGSDIGIFLGSGDDQGFLGYVAQHSPELLEKFGGLIGGEQSFNLSDLSNVGPLVQNVLGYVGDDQAKLDEILSYVESKAGEPSPRPITNLIRALHASAHGTPPNQAALDLLAGLGDGEIGISELFSLNEKLSEWAETQTTPITIIVNGAPQSVTASDIKGEAREYVMDNMIPALTKGNPFMALIMAIFAPLVLGGDDGEYHSRITTVTEQNAIPHEATAAQPATSPSPPPTAYQQARAAAITHLGDPPIITLSDENTPATPGTDGIQLTSRTAGIAT